MKLRGDKEYANEVLDYKTEGGWWVSVAQLDKYGDWWDVSTHWGSTNMSPDGARFLSKRAAQIYTRKHAIAAIIGGYKP